jgi:ADP-ribose pyrophosphatase YjhB (NUDIX family)
LETKLSYPDHVIPAHRFQYCPICKTPLKREAIFADGIPRIHCAECGWIQLVTNALCVAVVVTCPGGIVALHPPDGMGVGLPAGLVEYGEPPEATAIREVREETGFEAEIVRCLGTSFVSYPQFPGPTIYFLYEVRATGGELKDGDEGRVKIYPLDQFPAISPEGRHGSCMAMKLYLAALDDCQKRKER